VAERSSALGIHLACGPDADDEEVAEAASQLRRELLDLDVEAVETPRAGEPPEGTRAVEVAAVGSLLVTAGPQFLAAVIGVVRAWLGRSQQRSIRLELDGDVLELTGLPTDQQRTLANEWLRQHGSR
jgi:hypothetical protein